MALSIQRRVSITLASLLFGVKLRLSGDTKIEMRVYLFIRRSFVAYLGPIGIELSKNKK